MGAVYGVLAQRRKFFLAVGIFALSIISCGTVTPTQSGTGSIYVSVTMQESPSLAKAVATVPESLIISVSNSDMVTLRYSYSIAALQNTHSATLTGIPVGAIRYIQAWTISPKGDTIHVPSAKVVTITPGIVVPVSLVLMPRLGSIYVSLSSIPSVVDSVYASFVVGTTTYSTKVKRDTRAYLAIDNIPFNSTGSLTVAGLTVRNDTVGEAWHKIGYVFTNVNTTLEATFKNDGSVAMSVSLNMGAVTFIHGIYDTTLDSVGNEHGPLIISEIMYATNDSDYVELYNSSDVAFSDSILIDYHDSRSSKKLGVVTVAPKSFIIISNSMPSWNVRSAQVFVASTQLVSTDDAFSVKRSGNRVMDYCAFMTTSTNKLEWPAKATNTAIVLDSLVSNPEYNNYGRHWMLAKTLIDNSTTMYGSPGL